MHLHPGPIYIFIYFILNQTNTKTKILLNMIAASDDAPGPPELETSLQVIPEASLNSDIFSRVLEICEGISSLNCILLGYLHYP